MQVINYHTADQKLQWFGYGEWVEEPDEAIFDCEGFKCRVLRICAYESSGFVFGGHFCGYVKIPPAHPWYLKDDLECDCHGGITLHRTKLFEPFDEYWIGFDCAHSGDLVPSLKMFKKHMLEVMGDQTYEDILKINMPNYFIETYRNINFAISETKNIAMQASSKKCLFI